MVRQSNKSGFGRAALLPLLDPCLSPQAKALLVVYAAYSDMDWSREVTLERATIEKILGVPEIWLKRHKKELVDAGYITSVVKRQSADLFAGTCAHVTLLPWSDRIAQRMEAIEAKHPKYVSAAVQSESLVADGAGTGVVYPSILGLQTCLWQTILTYAYLACKSYGGKALPDAESVSRDIRLGVAKVRESMELLTGTGVLRRAGTHCYLTQDLRGMPVESEPAGNDPIGNVPIGNEPIGNEPTGNEPIGSDPTGNEPTGNDPTIYNNNSLLSKSYYNNSLYSSSHPSILSEGATEAAIGREIDAEGMIPRSWARDPPLVRRAVELMTRRSLPPDFATDYLEAFCNGMTQLLTGSGWSAPGGELVTPDMVWATLETGSFLQWGTEKDGSVVLLLELYVSVQRKMETVTNDPERESVRNVYAFLLTVIWTELTKGGEA